MVVPYRRFGTTCRFLLQGSSIPGEESSFFSDCLDLEDGTDKLVPKHWYGITVLRCVKFQKSTDLEFRGVIKPWTLTFLWLRQGITKAPI